MEYLVSLFFQNLGMALVFCGMVYAGLPRAALSARDKKWLYAKLIVVFMLAQAMLHWVFGGNSGKDLGLILIGQLTVTYLAGRFMLRPSH